VVPTSRVIDRASAAHLLTDLRQRRWSWRRDDLPGIAQALGWTNFEILRDDAGEGAFADAPVSFGGDEVDVLIEDGMVDRILIRVSDQPARKTDESLVFMHRSWTDLVGLATDLFGPPTRRFDTGSPDAQWRGRSPRWAW
jgi:uncharacterized protein DUF6301